jgi:hypothetical protein
MEFSFRSARDVEKIFSSHWKWDSTPISINKWLHYFNSWMERVYRIFVWVKLPSHSLEFYSMEMFIEIVNTFGSYNEADMSCDFCRHKESINCKDPHWNKSKKGLVAKKFLKKGYKSFVQCLDYSGVPFHCVRSHKYGHFVVDCDFLLKKKL